MDLYSLGNKTYYDEWEIIPEKQKNILIKEKLLDFLLFTKNKSPFYNKLGINYSSTPNDKYPLLNVPPISSSDIRNDLPPLGTNMLTDKSSFHTVFQSGGTSGMPKTALFTHKELELLNLGNARGFYATGLLPSDRVANLWAVGGLYMTFVHINRMLQQYGCMNFPFSNQTPSSFVHQVSELFKINVFTGITSVVLNTLRAIHQAGNNSLKVEKIYFGGEHIYETDRKELQQKFGVETIKAPGYGTVDSWYIGYQCNECENGVFHVHDDQVYVEIVDEDRPINPGDINSPGTPAEKGEAGMLYCTPMVRRLTPVVRYRVGDRARWLNETKCACGRTTPRFELLGRGDDLLRIGYDSVDYSCIQDIISKIEGLSGTAQMQKKRRLGKDELIIRIETDLDNSLHAQKRKEFINLFTEIRPSFNEFVEKGTVWPLVIELLPPKSIERNSRTGKLIRVQDCI